MPETSISLQKATQAFSKLDRQGLFVFVHVCPIKGRCIMLQKHFNANVEM